MNRRSVLLSTALIIPLRLCSKLGGNLPGVPIPLPQPFNTVVLDGSGNGVTSIGPTVVREHWQIASASVRCSSAVKEATCTVYFGSTLSTATFLDTTITGSSGDICGINQVDLQPGMQIWAQWQGGDVGATATLILNGTKTKGAPS